MIVPAPFFLFYGGKGGVGKTTCAAARAVAAAATGARVLVVSTDPAHSLGDALDARLSSRPSVVRVGRRTATALELDARRAFERWLSEHRPALGDILEHGTWLNRADVEALLDLALPGVDELVGLLEIARLARVAGPGARAHYDLVVVDTAPTGHALRLLASPATVAAVADILDELQESHRVIRQQLAGINRPEAADRLIALIAQEAHDMAATLRDPERTAFHWVTLPEALSLAESEDGIAALGRSGIRVAEVIVNRAIPDGGPCPICDRRRSGERRIVQTIRRRLAHGSPVRVIAAELREPRGITALARIGRALASDVGNTFANDVGHSFRGASAERAGSAPLKRRPAEDAQIARATAGEPSRVGSLVVSVSSRERFAAPETLAVFRDAKLLFVGGKGGVGKTTIAAAAAIRLARAQPGQRTLLLSTDPAHSLADVFDARPGAIGDSAAAIRGAPPNLAVRELDAASALAGRRIDLERALEEIASAFGAEPLQAALADAGEPGSRRSVRTTSVSASAARLIELAPPGIDELFGVLSVVEAGHEYNRIVVDTAPTGHALRLLEMPDAARGWVQAMLRMLLKYRTLVRPGRLAAELVDASKSIRALQATLRDASHTRFIVVTRAADVPRLETERLLDRLRRLKLSVPVVVSNAMTLAPGRCRRCRATAAVERRSLSALRRQCAKGTKRCAIIQTPLAAPAPRGVKALERWGARWMIDRDDG